MGKGRRAGEKKFFDESPLVVTRRDKKGMPGRVYMGGKGYPVQGPLLSCVDILRLVFYDLGMALLDFFGSLGAVVVAVFFRVLACMPYIGMALLLALMALFAHQAVSEAAEYEVMRYISEGCPSSDEAMKFWQ